MPTAHAFCSCQASDREQAGQRPKASSWTGLMKEAAQQQRRGAKSHVLPAFLSVVRLDRVDVEVTRAESVSCRSPVAATSTSRLRPTGSFFGRTGCSRPVPRPLHPVRSRAPALSVRLRTRLTYARAGVGEQVSVRTLPDQDWPGRGHQVVASADDTGFQLSGPDVPDGYLCLPTTRWSGARTALIGCAPRPHGPSLG